MKNRFFIYTMILMGSLFASCDEDLKPYADETCWVYYLTAGSNSESGKGKMYWSSPTSVAPQSILLIPKRL